MTRAEIRAGQQLSAAGAFDYRRPTHRSDCVAGGWNTARPCPFVGCAYHLFLEVTSTGKLKARRTVDALLNTTAPSCALDVADQGGTTLELTGEALNLTRERVRQIETMAIDRLKLEVPEVFEIFTVN